MADTLVSPMLSVPEASAAESDASVIRAIDIGIAVIALVFFAPLLLILALFIKLTSPGPVLFKQSRIGQNNRVFKCYKLRTMQIDAEARLIHLLETDTHARLEWMRDHKLKNDPRITPIGRFLRKSSFDELPQLFNLIDGTMSVVGPRPIVSAEITRYGNRFKDYCSVKPGITGLWQVSGRSNTTYRRRVAMDVVYARRRSVGLNLRIIAQTVPAVLAAKGSY